MAVPYTFATATTAIPLSQLDSNFATTITLGNTAIQLGNTVTTLNNMTMANVTISSGNVTITNASVTTANVTTANIATSIVTTSETLGYGTANGVAYLNATKVLTSGSALTFDGTNLATTGTASATKFIPTGGAATGNGMYLPAANTVAFSTSGTEAMRVDSSQNVGIGTSSPAQKLTVVGNILTVNAAGTDRQINVSTTGVQNTYLGFNNSGSTNSNGVLNNYSYVGNGNSYGLQILANGAVSATFDTSGNLGLGVTPSASSSLIKAFDFNTTGGIGSYSNSTSTQFTYVSSNAFINSSVNWAYKLTGYAAAAYMQNNGSAAHAWLTAPSGTAGNAISFTQAMTLDASGNLLVGTTSTTVGGGGSGTIGFRVDGANGIVQSAASGNLAAIFNRTTNDGTIVSLRQDGTEEGTISVSGTTVSYNAFAGSHWSQLQDGSKPDILRGTVMEAINELCEWPDEPTTERLPKSKVSDTAGSKKVYGVFMAWDNDWTATNDMYVTAVGAFICRVNADVVVEQGDLLESNGDGTARVQADDVIRSSTIGKVTSTVKTHEYPDGSYCVPTVLYCG